MGLRRGVPQRQLPRQTVVRRQRSEFTDLSNP